MEPLSAVALAGNALQFLEFAVKLVSKGRQIHTSRDGLLIDYADVATTAACLNELSRQLESDLQSKPLTRQAGNVFDSSGLQNRLDYALRLGSGEEELEGILRKKDHVNLTRADDRTDVILRVINEGCFRVACELTEALESLRYNGRRSKWKSMRQAFKSIYGQSRINDLRAQLENYRATLDTCLLVAMRQQTRFSPLLNSNKSLNSIQDAHKPGDVRAWARQLTVLARDVQTYDRENQRCGVDSALEFSNKLTEWGQSTWIKQHTEDIIANLYFDDKGEREFRITQAHIDTFQWVFESHNSTTHTEAKWSSMSDWLESDENVYWITGKAGSGKSTLVKYLTSNARTMDCLRKWAGPMPLVVAKFYFWNSGSVAQMSQVGLLRSLLYDILTERPELVSDAFPERMRIASNLGKNTRPFADWELLQAFKTVLKLSEDSFKLCLFVDGLDEFDGDHEMLVHIFAETVANPNVKACLASRPWVVFEDAFHCKPNLQLHLLTYPDIVRFTAAQFRANSHFKEMVRREPTREVTLIEAVATRAAGVFLWVELATKSLVSGLRNHDRMSDLQRRLDTVPPDLETFYEKIFSSIEDFYYEHACQFLQLARVAKGSLTVLELSFSDEDDYLAALSRPNIALDADEKSERHLTMKRRLNSRCKGLLEIPTSQESNPWVHRIQPHASSRMSQMTEIRDGTHSGPDISPEETSQALDVHSRGRAFHDVKISYLHRTARDFFESKVMVRKINSGTKEPFCPFSSLFHSSIMSLKTFPGPIDEQSKTQFWELIDRSLTLAADVERARGEPQTRLLGLIDEIVMEKTQCSRDQMGLKTQDSSLARSQYWAIGSRLAAGASTLADLAMDYQMPLYMLETIRAALPHDTGDKPDKHQCLFHVVRDYKHHAGLCEWVGHRTPRLSFVNFLLETGADPNQSFIGVTPFEIVLSEAITVANDATISDRKRALELWALIVDSFVRHNANPRVNRNSAMGSRVREAFGEFLPQTSQVLERKLTKSTSKWSAARKFITPPSIGGTEPIVHLRPRSYVPIEVAHHYSKFVSPIVQPRLGDRASRPVDSSAKVLMGSYWQTAEKLHNHDFSKVVTPSGCPRNTGTSFDAVIVEEFDEELEDQRMELLQEIEKHKRKLQQMEDQRIGHQQMELKRIKMLEEIEEHKRKLQQMEDRQMELQQMKLQQMEILEKIEQHKSKRQQMEYQWMNRQWVEHRRMRIQQIEEQKRKCQQMEDQWMEHQRNEERVRELSQTRHSLKTHYAERAMDEMRQHKQTEGPPRLTLPARMPKRSKRFLQDTLMSLFDEAFFQEMNTSVEGDVTCSMRNVNLDETPMSTSHGRPFGLLDIDAEQYQDDTERVKRASPTEQFLNRKPKRVSLGIGDSNAQAASAPVESLGQALQIREHGSLGSLRRKPRRDDLRRR